MLRIKKVQIFLATSTLRKTSPDSFFTFSQLRSFSPLSISPSLLLSFPLSPVSPQLWSNCTVVVVLLLWYYGSAHIILLFQLHWHALLLNDLLDDLLDLVHRSTFPTITHHLIKRTARTFVGGRVLVQTKWNIKENSSYNVSESSWYTWSYRFGWIATKTQKSKKSKKTTKKMKKILLTWWSVTRSRKCVLSLDHHTSQTCYKPRSDNIGPSSDRCCSKISYQQYFILL